MLVEAARQRDDDGFDRTMVGSSQDELTTRTQTALEALQEVLYAVNMLYNLTGDDDIEDTTLV